MRGTILAWRLCWRLLSAAPTGARAEPATPSTGTWAFQSEDYGNERLGAAMSGVARDYAADAPTATTIKPAGARSAQSTRETDDSRLLIARQNCTGENADGQLTITCQMAEPLEGYQPDTFVLQAGRQPINWAAC